MRPRALLCRTRVHCTEMLSACALSTLPAFLGFDEASTNTSLKSRRSRRTAAEFAENRQMRIERAADEPQSRTLGPVHIGAGAEEDFGGIHYCLRKRGMWVDGERNIFGERAHFDGEHAFGDEFAGPGAHNSHTQHALSLGINDQLGHAFGSIDGKGTARGGPREPGYFDLAIFFLCLSLGESAPCDLGIGKNNSGDRVGFEGNFVSGDGFRGGASFVHGLVGQHGLAYYIADGVDRGIVGLKPLIYLDESALDDFYLSFFQAGDFGIW